MYCVDESLPDPDASIPPIVYDRRIRVYSDMDQVQTFLSDGRFEIVDNQDEADIWWIKHHYTDYRYAFSNCPEGPYCNYTCVIITTCHDRPHLFIRLPCLLQKGVAIPDRFDCKTSNSTKIAHGHKLVHTVFIRNLPPYALFTS